MLVVSENVARTRKVLSVKQKCLTQAQLAISLMAFNQTNVALGYCKSTAVKRAVGYKAESAHNVIYYGAPPYISDKSIAERLATKS